MTAQRSLARRLDLIFLILITGCATTRAYDGPPRSSNEVSRVKIFGGNFVKVNGVEIGGMTEEVEMLPGRNEVELKVSASNFNAKDVVPPVFKLALFANPGTNYVITGQRGEGRLCAWPVRKDTGDPDFSNPSGCIYRE